MDTFDMTMCYICLVTERKLKPLIDFWSRKLFSQIIYEIPFHHPDDRTIWVCWECEAIISRFMRFKQQVKDSYMALWGYTERPASITRIPKLQTHTQFNISISGNEERRDSYESIVNRVLNVVEEVRVREVANDAVSDFDEDAFLIDRKRKKPKKTFIPKKLYKVVLLSKEEIKRERKQMELGDEYANAMFSCEHCIEPFANLEDFNDHVKLKHEMKPSNFTCDICLCVFNAESSYNNHQKKHSRRFACVACLDMFMNKRTALNHYNMVHCRETDLINSLESKRVIDEAEKRDVTSNSEDQPATFACDYCDKIFKWKTSLRKHLETHRIETGLKRKPYCESCSQSFTSTANLQKHVKTSSKHQITLKMRKMEAEGTNPSRYKDEIALVVNESRRRHACPQCDRVFQWRGNLIRHVRSHTAKAKGELVCKPCNRTFSSIATFNQHMKISKNHVSENEFKYMCSDCGMKFINKVKLRDHINWEHLKNYVHKCSRCQKIFKSNTSLYLHKQVVHKKPGTPHLCDLCGKPFPNRTKLRGHVRAVHSDESPYQCQHCSAKFSWHSCLSRHQRRKHKGLTAT